MSEITHPKKQAFLDNYPKVKRIIETCRATSIGTTKFYDWLRDDDVFKEAWETLKKEVDQQRLEQYEDELDKRALGGASKQSDILLMFGLKAFDPGKYREKPPETRLVGDIVVKLAVPAYTDTPILQEEPKKELKDAVEQG